MLIAPSILSADFLHLARDIELLNESQADWLHFDVMDGVFVPNISFGLPVLKAVKLVARKPIDVHLMIAEPGKYVDAFADAGADQLTVHIEASTHLHRTIGAIKERGMKAGVSLNPHTSVSQLEEILPDLDLVLLMSVNPGFGGQPFIPGTLAKIRRMRRMVAEQNLNTEIIVDGGITLKNVADVRKAGATGVVAGSSVFGSRDPLVTISEMKEVSETYHA